MKQQIIFLYFRKYTFYNVSIRNIFSNSKQQATIISSNLILPETYPPSIIYTRKKILKKLSLFMTKNHERSITKQDSRLQEKNEI